MGFLVLKLPFSDYCIQRLTHSFFVVALLWCAEKFPGGDEDHPIITHFGQIFQALQPLLAIKNGNERKLFW